MSLHQKVYLKQDPKRLIEEANEVLVQAARDLATFTPLGIGADYISELALKCEEFEKLWKNKGSLDRLETLEFEILRGLKEIVKTGEKVWQQRPNKRRQYHVTFLNEGNDRSRYSLL